VIKLYTESDQRTTTTSLQGTCHLIFKIY